MTVEFIAPNRVRLSGELTVRTIAEAHQSITTELAGHEVLRIETADVSEADLTLVQLIESAQRTATMDGKRLELVFPLAATLLEQLERGGFLRGGGAASFWQNAG